MALQKSLRLLVVNDKAAAAICSEFLKEQSLSMDVLVLENIPSRNFDQSVANKIARTQGASLVYEVIDVSRGM